MVSVVERKEQSDEYLHDGRHTRSSARPVALGRRRSPGSRVGVALALTSSSGGHTTDSAVAPKAPALVASAAQDARRVPSILSLTPAELAGGALGTSYALSPAPTGPTAASVLRSMSPETRRYTKAVMALTFAQLAAGAAGSP